MVLESDGTSSVLNVSALTSFTETNGWTDSTLQASNSGTVNDSSLASLSNVNLTSPARASDLVLASLTSFSSGNITVSGGASLSLPGVTSYTGNNTHDHAGGHRHRQHADPGQPGERDRTADLRCRSPVRGPGRRHGDAVGTEDDQYRHGGAGKRRHRQRAERGGMLTSFTETNGWTYSTLQASNGGTVNDSSSLTSLSNVNLNVGGPIVLGGLTDVSHVNLTVSGTGENLTYAGLASFDKITVSGGASLSLPALTSPDGITIEANGGTLTLPGLTSAESDTLEVSGGGTLILPAPTAFTATGSTVTVSGSGSSVQIGSGVLDRCRPRGPTARSTCPPSLRG